VEAGERYELKLVPHLGQARLEGRDRFWVELLLPVERRRTVVG
jgi:hypothetical protein